VCFKGTLEVAEVWSSESDSTIESRDVEREKMSVCEGKDEIWTSLIDYFVDDVMRKSTEGWRDTRRERRIGFLVRGRRGGRERRRIGSTRWES